jgi:hypothetical protein
MAAVVIANISMILARIGVPVRASVMLVVVEFFGLMFFPAFVLSIIFPFLVFGLAFRVRQRRQSGHQ